MNDVIPIINHVKEPSLELLSLDRFYSERVLQYDSNMHLTFEIQGCDEVKIRQDLISKLGLSSSSRLLEVGVGTGRDTVQIIKALNRLDGGRNEYHGCDISMAMLEYTREKIVSEANNCATVELARASVTDLPYEDDFFDGVYSFGSICEVDDVSKALREISRVCKDGARVVLADEGIPIHLRKTRFYKYLQFTNPAFSYLPPLDLLPSSARNASLEWVNNDTFFVLSYSVIKQEPTADFDRLIPGRRGGSLRTRVDGQLPGVTSELLSRFHEEVEATGESEYSTICKILESYFEGNK